MKKILIISNGYPSQGGRSTTAYNLLIFLNSINFDAKVLFLNDFNSNGEVDPENTGRSFNITYRKTLAYTLVRSLIQKIISTKIFKNIGLTYLIKLAISKTKDILINREIIESDTLTPIEAFVTKNNLYPDLAITNSPMFYEIFNKIFEKTKTLIIVGSTFPIIQFGIKVDSQMILENPNLFKNKRSENVINILNKIKSQLIFNSQLSYNFYSSYGIRPINKSVQYFNFAPYIISESQSFFDRKYDIGFIISDFRRIVKNPEKMLYLFSAFPEKKKIAIGKGTNLISNIPNIITFDLGTQKEIASFLSEIKLIVIPSYYDLSPSILSEAILNGCNVLSSKNVGWNEMLEKSCVVQNYHDNNEWIKKVYFLLNNKVENKKFLNTIHNSKNELLKLFNDMLSDH